jgi:N-acetylated-alpha-linked acidic dipeptidase
MPSRFARPGFTLAALLVGMVRVANSAPTEKPLLGFTPDRSREERSLESRFDGSLHADDLQGWLQHLSARPHHLGSPYDKQNAEYEAGLFRSWGFDTQIEEFSVLFPTPLERKLELVAPTKYVALLSEPALREDTTSGQISEALPPYTAYSIDGDVTGDLVYVGDGVPADYDELAAHGIDVKGKIVISRYGGSWRGIKPKVAAEHGAIGCLIYSDPHEDGYFQGDVYPKGGYRNEHSVQRGSVADMPLYPGDPLTPGIGATADAKRLAIKDAPTLTKIPVLPISYADARPLLAAMGGPMAPASWRGSLPLTYHLGPGPARVHLKVRFDWKQVPAYDVIARLRGSELPDEWIVRGNHSDGWVNGATDPLSGLVGELAEAKALGELVKGGWHPRRTIIYAAWDGEEPGLLGSTEWVETHATELAEHAVVYLNSDSNTRGFLGMGGSHTLERFMIEVARDVQDPERKISVGERLRATQRVAAEEGGTPRRGAGSEDGELHLGALGSGSDYTPFLQHLGIASLNIGYGGEGEYGQYHSAYDSFSHFERFQDPKEEYGVALAKTAGRIVLRFAQADVLPFDFVRFEATVGRYVKEVNDLSDRQRRAADERNQMLADHAYENAADPTQTYVPPARLEPVPHFNLSPLDNALEHVRRSAKAYQKALDAVSESATPVAAETGRTVDAALMKTERDLTGPGLPRRPWFVHQIYAPGFYTGYGVKTLPVIREGIEQRHYDEVEAGVTAAAKSLDALATEVDRATAALNGRSAGARTGQ